MTLGKLINWGYFVLDNEISIPDALSIFTTIGLAIYITKTLEKQVQNRRVEKDLLLSKIGEIEQSVCNLSEIINTNNTNYYKLVALTKNCSMPTNTIFKTVTDLKLNINELELKQNLKNNISDLRQLSTMISVISENTEPTAAIKIENGIVSYSSARIIEIDSVLDDMKDNYFKLKFLINMG